MLYALIILVQCHLGIIVQAEYVNDIWQSKNTEGIELIISNIRNKDGLIRIGVFDSETGYPDNPSFSFSLAKDTLFSGKLRLFIPIKNPGNFGISVLDDENRNGKMDYIFGIKPKEGFGFSNNPKVTSRKAPPFEQTRFKYSGWKIKISISMVYI